MKSSSKPSARPRASTARSNSTPLGLARCPFCHDDVDSGSHVACQGCLARHHADCWVESGHCAACSGEALLESPPGWRAGRVRWTLVLAFGLTLACGLPVLLRPATSVTPAGFSLESVHDRLDQAVVAAEGALLVGDWRGAYAAAEQGGSCLKTIASVEDRLAGSPRSRAQLASTRELIARFDDLAGAVAGDEASAQERAAREAVRLLRAAAPWLSADSPGAPQVDEQAR